MIQFENHFRHSSKDKVFEAVCGVKDNEGLSFVIHLELGFFAFFFNFSPNSHGMIMRLLLALNSTIVWVKVLLNLSDCYA
jgi:hypothetical protein